ncbi:type II toxin-antitoxin system VapC family toxin [Desulfonema magnum]|uniref:PIN domain-containing protein n=1 Tax=Desulfonema magnum TaxID=45655 RepID=A0A975BIM5_9BACT|nr:type II toxin-antitoxin system VapC family toxin [Desulfonema magnum]QTA86031.1 PIN domain-containing protein [Desulfonema magnum]
MKQILLDTNAYSRFMGGDENVLDVLAKAQIVYFSIFVLGELFAGFRGGSKEQENRKLLDKFIRKPTVSVLNGSDKTANIFGMLRDTLKKAGTPLPINDIWIASHAIETDSVVITYDSHFKKIPGLRIWKHLC